MLTLVLIAVVAFVVTNLDDLVVLTAFCGHERYRLQEILLGQYLGFGTLVGVSVVGGVGAATFLTDHVRWLGLLPITVGVYWYANARRSDGAASSRRPETQSSARTRAGLVAGIGITDGADNLGVYIPLFAAIEPFESTVVIAVFLLAAGVWVLFAHWLARRPLLADRLDEHSDTVVPIVLVSLGVVILADLI
jgi:cadmium resistance protein CadD (predicted permease)